RAFKRGSPPSPQLRSGVLRPLYSTVNTLPNDTLFMQPGLRSGDAAFRAARSVRKRLTSSGGTLRVCGFTEEAFAEESFAEDSRERRVVGVYTALPDGLISIR